MDAAATEGPRVVAEGERRNAAAVACEMESSSPQFEALMRLQLENSLSNASFSSPAACATDAASGSYGCLSGGVALRKSEPSGPLPAAPPSTGRSADPIDERYVDNQFKAFMANQIDKALLFSESFVLRKLANMNEVASNDDTSGEMREEVVPREVVADNSLACDDIYVGFDVKTKKPVFLPLRVCIDFVVFNTDFANMCFECSYLRAAFS